MGHCKNLILFCVSKNSKGDLGGYSQQLDDGSLFDFMSQINQNAVVFGFGSKNVSREL